jgi:hypothetical protein
MEYNKLNYRFLEKNEFNTFTSLQDSLEYWMKKKKDPSQDNSYKDLREELFHRKNNKIAGAFDSDNNLVATSSGLFPIEFPYWYTHNQFHKTPNQSLNSGLDSWLILMKLMELLCKYGEENNYYSFYTQRPLKHQLLVEKARQRAEEKNLYHHRYDLYWEYVYSAGQVSTKHRNHSFYFHNGLALNSHIDTVVALYTLKQDYRLEWFKKTNPDNVF